MNLEKGSKNFIKKVEGYLNFLNPLHKNGKPEGEIEKKSNFKNLTHNSITWIDIENPKKAELLELAEKYDFHSLHTEASISLGELDRVEFEENYIFILLHSPSYDTSEHKIVGKQICIFIGKDYVITVHRGNRKNLYEAINWCEENPENKELFFKKSSSRLLYSIMSIFEKDVSNLLQTLLQELDEVEDLVFDVKDSGIYRISHLRQKVVKLRRVTLSFREITQALISQQNSLIEKSNRYFKDISNNFNKLFEVLEETKETIEIYKDADFTFSTERTNKILTVLTIVFTLSIPTTIIGSIYSMNVLTPGSTGDQGLNFLGEYTTFYMLSASAFIITLLMLAFFKYKDWF